MVLEMWIWAGPMVERMMNMVVLVLGRPPKYLQLRTHFSLEQNHLIDFTDLFLVLLVVRNRAGPV